ncbi:PREDICTED: titin-like [Poecilia mexicana]|uniref:titin-like n=1 Tax=Poecilia mexicana TaxID=48701 RepID=UPI00072EBAAC|nr:PREDICTED: titin-like [Poecilia mexicana]
METVIPAGGSVTLTCSVDGSTGWKFDWFRNGQQYPADGSSRNTEPDGTIRVSVGGKYSCRGGRGGRGDPVFESGTSNEVTIQRTDYKPTATLRASYTIIPAGGSVTLTCSVDGSTGWKFDWFRNGQQYPADGSSRNTEPDGTIRVSVGGEYSCRGGRGGREDPVSESETSNKVTIWRTVSSKPSLILEPNWSQIYRGEKVTLTCEIQDDGGTQWTYEWRTTNGRPITSSEHKTITATELDSGEYSCRGIRDYKLTEWSDSVRLTVKHYKPTATLIAMETTIPAGGSVTLTCSVEGSTGWKFDWFRNGQQYPADGSSRNTEPDGTIRVSEGGKYSCRGGRGGRGDPVFESGTSNKVTIWRTDPNKPSLVLQPNWSQIYSGEKVTLRCEIQDDGGTQWTYEWIPINGKTPTPSEHKTITATELDSGEYSCRGFRDYKLTEWSDSVRLTVKHYKPTATLRASYTIIPAGGSVTLTCSVDGSTGWKFDWFRNGQQYPADGSSRNTEPDGTIRVSEGGKYSCRGGRGDPVSESGTSYKVTIQITDPNKPSLVLQPNWSQIYRGEKVTLRCEIQGGTQWTYEWRTTNRNSPSSSEYKINSATESLSGEYSCRGKREGFSWTPWSNVVNIAVSPKPQPVLSVSPSWLNPGASVTLSCEGLEHQPAGWRFFWYKAVPGPSSSSYTSELLPGSTNGSEQNSFIINGPTLTAGFVCRAGRGEPEFYTYYSEPKFIWSADPRPAASLSVNPDRVQHFRSESVTLNCEGNSSEWRVKRFTETGKLSNCSIWGNLTGSTCIIDPNRFNSGVYWCESKSGEFSNAVNITVQDDDSAPLLLSPVLPVTEGDPVTLSCRDKKQQLLSNVFFYHNDKLIHSDSRGELNISAVSKSDEGFYKCQHSGKDSPRSWMSVRVAVSSPVSSSFPVMLIVGPVVGVVLIILIILLVLWRCRWSKDDGGLDSLYETIHLSSASGNGKRNVMVRSPPGLAQGKGKAD